MKKIQNFTQRISYAILETTGCHVTIANNESTRIAGTGEFEEKIGLKIPWNSAFEYSMKNRKTVVIEEPGKNKICNGCENIDYCDEEYEICTPIISNNKVIGVIAIIATTIKQKEYIKRRENGFIEYLKNMSMLLSSYMNEFEIKKEIEIKNQELQTIIEKSSNATICVSKDKEIKYINAKAMSLFNLEASNIILEKTKINELWEKSLLERAINGYGNDTIIEEEVYENKNNQKRLISSQIT